MFTYIDPEVRQKLINQGKLVRVDSKGKVISPTQSPEADDLALNILGPIPLPIRIADEDTVVDWYAAVRHTELSEVEALAKTLREKGAQSAFADIVSSMAVNNVLVVGDLKKSSSPLVRVHSNCLTGDVFGSQRCECGPQLTSALEAIKADPEGGLLVYMTGHEGRGIGLWAKAATYILQDAGENTYQANHSLGLPDDCRDFTDAAALLHYFVGNREFRLLTNNPKKVNDLGDMGLTKITPQKHVVGVGGANKRYLAAKRDWGHKIDVEDLNDK